MAWAKIERDKVVEYPYTPAKLRAEYPSVSFSDVLADEALADYGVVEVAEVSPPTVTTGQVAVLGAPALVAGAWRQTWTVRTKGPNELAAARLAALESLAAQRFGVETGGIMVSGMRIATDRQTQSTLTAAYVLAKENPAFALDWKAGRGEFVTIDAATAIAVAGAVINHVQACFSYEKVLSAAIQGAASFAALDAIDIAAGWPK